MNYEYKKIPHQIRSKYLRNTSASKVIGSSSGGIDTSNFITTEWFYKDENGNIHCPRNLVGDLEVSAFGAGNGQSSLVETDPIFTASPAHNITNAHIAKLNVNYLPLDNPQAVTVNVPNSIYFYGGRLIADDVYSDGDLITSGMVQGNEFKNGNVDLIDATGTSTRTYQGVSCNTFYNLKESCVTALSELDINTSDISDVIAALIQLRVALGGTGVYATNINVYSEDYTTLNYVFVIHNATASTFRAREIVEVNGSRIYTGTTTDVAAGSTLAVQRQLTTSVTNGDEVKIYYGAGNYIKRIIE